MTRDSNPRELKLFLVGPSGSGKTTTLRWFDPNAKHLGDQQRDPTPAEAAAWGWIPANRTPNYYGSQTKQQEKPLKTTTFPNFGQALIAYDSKNDKFFVDHTKGLITEKSFLVTIVDGCGQQYFYPYREGGAAGAHGILFILDSSRVEVAKNENTGNLEHPYIREIFTAFNELYDFYAEGNVYGPPTRHNPHIPPTVIMCNKQDIVEERLKGTMIEVKDDDDKQVEVVMGRVPFWRALLRSYDPQFFGVLNFPYIETCALPLPKPYGIEDAVGELFREIYKRLNRIEKHLKIM